MLTEHVIIYHSLVWSKWNEAHNYIIASNYWVKVENEFPQQFNVKKTWTWHTCTHRNKYTTVFKHDTHKLWSCSLPEMSHEHILIIHRRKHTHTQHVSIQTGEQASFCWRENGKCEGRDEGDKCPPGPWGYPNGVIHHPSQSHAEQSCQCMNAALLLSAILIMAPVTALINTITSHWKSLIKTLRGCRLTSNCVRLRR